MWQHDLLAEMEREPTQCLPRSREAKWLLIPNGCDRGGAATSTERFCVHLNLRD